MDSDTDFTEQSIHDSRDFYLLGLKQDWSYELHNRMFLKWGFDVKSLHAKYDYHNSFTDERITYADSLIIKHSQTDAKADYSFFERPRLSG